MSRPIKRYESIATTVPLNFNGNKITIGDLPQLRSDKTKDIIIRAIEFFTADSVPVDFNGNPVATFAQLQNLSLTLYVEGEESLTHIPLVKLLNIAELKTNYLYSIDVTQFENLMVDWTKSYFYFATPLGGATALFDILWGVSYQRLKPGTMNQLKQQAGQSNCASPGDISMM